MKHVKTFKQLSESEGYDHPPFDDAPHPDNYTEQEKKKPLDRMDNTIHQGDAVIVMGLRGRYLVDVKDQKNGALAVRKFEDGMNGKVVGYYPASDIEVEGRPDGDDVKPYDA